MSDNPYDPPRSDCGDGLPQALAGKHSGIGVVSFVLSLVCGSVAVVGSVLTTVEEVLPDAIYLAAGLGIVAAGFIAVVGLIFGIAGALEPDRKKIFALLGSVVNGLVVLGVVAAVIHLS